MRRAEEELYQGLGNTADSIAQAIFKGTTYVGAEKRDLLYPVIFAEVLRKLLAERKL